jgi:hypothetical protein
MALACLARLLSLHALLYGIPLKATWQSGWFTGIWKLYFPQYRRRQTQQVLVQIRFAACWVVRNLIYLIQSPSSQGQNTEIVSTDLGKIKAALLEAGVVAALNKVCKCSLRE